MSPTKAAISGDLTINAEIDIGCQIDIRTATKWMLRSLDEFQVDNDPQGYFLLYFKNFH